MNWVKRKGVIWNASWWTVTVHAVGNDAVPVGQGKEGMEKTRMWWKVASLKMNDAIGDVYLDDVETLTLWLAVVI
jgi:hypothetical protein